MCVCVCVCMLQCPLRCPRFPYSHSLILSISHSQAEVMDQLKVVIKDVTAERRTHMIEGSKKLGELKLTMEQLDKVSSSSFHHIH